MTAHPNRSARPDAPAANPEPAAIQQARVAVHLTQREAAALVYCTTRAWEDWEQGQRRMHPATWELFRLKAGARASFAEALTAADLRLAAMIAELRQPTNGG